MLVEPTRVHPRRGRWVAALIAALLGIASLSLLASLSPRSPQPTFPGQATPVAAQTTRPPSVAVAGRRPELEVRLIGPAGKDSDLLGDGSPASGSLASGFRLQLDGWVPGQFGWATVDVFDAERRLGGPAMRVGLDGTISGTVDLSPWGETVDRLVIRLSGLNDVQLYAVPLLTVLVPAQGAALPVRQAGSAVPR